MKALVHYVDFHADNHQGGVGNSFEFKVMIAIPADTYAKDIFKYISDFLAELTKKQRPFTVHESVFAIQRVEIFD